jgi:predicted alpha/beta hydrolase
MEKSNKNIQVEPINVRCADGVMLKGVLLIPDKSKAVIQFNGGTATKKEFYLAFLNYLAQHGYICCLWDYRGSGASAPQNMKECDFTFSDYGIIDMPAIKKYLNERFPHLPFLFFNHSVGGQQLGFMNNLENVVGAVNFAVSTGYAPNMPWAYRSQSFYFFYIFTPISNFLVGYLKAKRFGYMEDLPKNVVNEWKYWCEKKDYFFDTQFYGKTIPEGNFKNFNFPIHTFWTVDDTISNEKNTFNFWVHINSSKPITFTKLTPSDFDVKSIGHFGFFKKTMKDTLWKMGLAQLEEFLKLQR